MKNINEVINEKYTTPKRYDSKSNADYAFVNGVSSILKGYKILLKSPHKNDFIVDAKTLYNNICEYGNQTHGEHVVDRMLEEINDKQINKALELDSSGEYKYSADVWEKALKNYLGI